MDRSSFDEEKSSFQDTDTLLAQSPPRNSHEKESSIRRRFSLSCLNCLILLLNIILFAALVFRNWIPVSKTVQTDSSKFLNPALEMEVRTFDDVFHDHESPYRGEPRPELDQAWQKLLRGFNTRIPSPGWQTPSQQDRNVTHLSDGSHDIMGVPIVLHNIHCLRTIREYLFPENYPITASRYKPVPPSTLNVHIDHCLDTIRQSVMCQPDMTVAAYEWWPNSPYPQVIPQSEHVCANWDRLTTWLQAHSFPRWGDILRHPVTGEVPFPNA